ncbi:MAG: hypothetical protein ACRDAU_01045 [Clostridium sp.]
MKNFNKKNINLFNTLSNHSKKLTVGSIIASSFILVNVCPALTAHATTLNKDNTKITEHKYNVSIQNSVTPINTSSPTVTLEPTYSISSNISGIPNFNNDYTTYNLTYIFGGNAILCTKSATNINPNNYYVSVNNLNEYNLDMSDGSSAQSSSLTNNLNQMSLNIVNSAISKNYSNSNYTIYSGSELLKLAQSGQSLPNINAIVHRGSLDTSVFTTNGWADDSMMGAQVSNVVVGISNTNSSNYFTKNFTSLTNSNSDTLFTNGNGGYDFVLGSYGYLDGMTLGNGFTFQPFTQIRDGVTNDGSNIGPNNSLSSSPYSFNISSSCINSQSASNGITIGTSLGSFLELDGLNNNYLTLNISGANINPSTSTVTLNYVNTNNETTSKTVPLSNFINLGNGNYAYKLSNIKDFAHFTSNNPNNSDFTAQLYFANGQTPSTNINITGTLSSNTNGSTIVNGLLPINNNGAPYTVNISSSPASITYFS